MIITSKKLNFMILARDVQAYLLLCTGATKHNETNFGHVVAFNMKMIGASNVA